MVPAIRMATLGGPLREHPAGTVVRLREHGSPNTPEGMAGFMNCAAGWGEAATLLKFYAEHGLRD